MYDGSTIKKDHSAIEAKLALDALFLSLNLNGLPRAWFAK
jgi:hypothetical protein